MAPVVGAPTVTPVGAGHGSLSAAAKPVISDTDDTIFGIPKWALAVAAGSAVALGLAYYVLSAPNEKGKKGGKRKKDKSTKNKATSDSTVSSTTSTPVKPKEKGQKVDENKVIVEDVGEEEEVVSNIYAILITFQPELQQNAPILKWTPKSTYKLILLSLRSFPASGSVGQSDILQE
jgi:hypothetical protein